MDDYQYHALSKKYAPLRDSDSTRTKLNLCAMGLPAEAGEVADLVKKHIFHGHSLDKEKMLLELGDVLWYLTYAADALGYTLDDVAEANLGKLEARYPDGFSPESSINRKV